MATNVKKNWETDVVDVPSTTVANLITTLKGGESITIHDLGAIGAYHYIGLKHLVEVSRGYKLEGTMTMTLTLPASFGRDNEIEIWAMATNAGDDLTYFKLIDLEPETASG